MHTHPTARWQLPKETWCRCRVPTIRAAIQDILVSRTTVGERMHPNLERRCSRLVTAIRDTIVSRTTGNVESEPGAPATGNVVRSAFISGLASGVPKVGCGPAAPYARPQGGSHSFGHRPIPCSVGACPRRTCDGAAHKGRRYGCLLQTPERMNTSSQALPIPCCVGACPRRSFDGAAHEGRRYGCLLATPERMNTSSQALPISRSIGACPRRSGGGRRPRGATLRLNVGGSKTNEYVGVSASCQM
jgi:hypothetical protein